MIRCLTGKRRRKVPPLRDYQYQFVQAVREALRKKKRVLSQLPTGAGKTRCFVEIVRQLQELNANRYFRVLVLINRRSLIDQIGWQLEKLQLGVSYYAASMRRREQGKLTIAMVQSIARAEELSGYDLIVCDEAHRIGVDSQWSDLLNRLVKVTPGVRVLGVTATPYSGRGEIWGEKEFFPEPPVFQMNIAELTKLKHLVPAILAGSPASCQFDLKGVRIQGGEWNAEELNRRAKEEPRARAQIEDALKRSVGRKKLIWCCCGIEHAKLIHGLLREFGEASSIVHSLDDEIQRDSELEGFTNGGARHLVFVSIVSEGFDYPPIDCVVLLRPTRSAVLYVQTIGRALRPSPDKLDALVLDYGQVVMHCGPLDRPFFKKKGVKQSAVHDETVRQCELCGLFFFTKPAHFPPCPHCGAENKPTKKIASKELKKTAATGSIYEDPIMRGEGQWVSVTSFALDQFDDELWEVFQTPLGEFRRIYQIPPRPSSLPTVMGKFRAIKAELARFGIPDGSAYEMIEKIRTTSVKAPGKVYVTISDRKVREWSTNHDAVNIASISYQEDLRI